MTAKETAGDVFRVLLLLGISAGVYQVLGDDIILKMSRLFLDNFEWTPSNDWLAAIYWIIASLVSGLIPYHFRARRILEKYTPEKIEQMISEWKGRLDQLETTVNRDLENMKDKVQDVIIEHGHIQRMLEQILKTFPELRAVLRQEVRGEAILRGNKK